MQISQVAAQLYTVRHHLTSPASFADAIRRLKKMGYPAVELVLSDKVTEKESQQICLDEGVTIAAVHVAGSVLLSHAEDIAEMLERIGTRIAVYAYPTGIDLTSRLEVERLASRLEQSAQVLNRAGFVLAYHNHAVEFHRIQGELALDIIQQTAPSLAFELDTYWVQYGGGNVERWIRALKGKLATLHLKDYGFDLHHDAPFMAEVGYGNLDMPGLVAAAEEAGAQWFVVEQDETPGDPFVSLQKSLEYLQTNVARPEEGVRLK
jgi:sugar phosphate isomerase/epimerase